MSKILCFSANTKESQEFFSGVYKNEITVLDGEVQDYDKIENIDEVEIITCFTGSVFDKPTLERFPNLKLIAARSTGYNHIDISACKELGIEVSNVPMYGANTVAEHAFALLLALSRKAYFSYEKVKEDMNFSRRGTQELKGFDLQGKTIGIIGAGNIGQHAIKIAHGFGMNISAFDLHPNDELTKKYGVSFEPSVEALYQKSDIVTFHVPYNKHTHHLFNDKSANYLKDGGVILINTSRGAVIDTKALYSALESGKVVACGLDVLEHEALLGRETYEKSSDLAVAEIEEVSEINKKLVGMNNVIVTPHNAFNTTEAIQRIWDVTIENINSHSDGEAINTV